MLTWHVVIIDLDISWLTILHLHVLLQQQSVGVRLSSQLRPRNARIIARTKGLQDNPFHPLSLRPHGELTTRTGLFCSPVHLRNIFYFTFCGHLPLLVTKFNSAHERHESMCIRYVNVALVFPTNPTFPSSSSRSSFMHLASVVTFFYTVPLCQLLFSSLRRLSSLSRQMQGVDEHLPDGGSYMTCCQLGSTLFYLEA